MIYTRSPGTENEIPAYSRLILPYGHSSIRFQRPDTLGKHQEVLILRELLNTPKTTKKDEVSTQVSIPLPSSQNARLVHRSLRKAAMHSLEMLECL